MEKQSQDIEIDADFTQEYKKIVERMALEAEEWIIQSLEEYRIALNKYKNEEHSLIPHHSKLSHRSLSIHDHVLTHEECLNHFMFFRNIKIEKEMVEYRDFEKRMKRFFKLIFESTTIFVSIPHDDYVKYKKIKNINRLKKYVVYELRKEQNKYDFLLPEYRTLIRSNFDLTWPVTMYEPLNEQVLYFAEKAGINII